MYHRVLVGAAVGEVGTGLGRVVDVTRTAAGAAVGAALDNATGVAAQKRERV